MPFIEEVYSIHCLYEFHFFMFNRFEGKNELHIMTQMLPGAHVHFPMFQ